MGNLEPFPVKGSKLWKMGSFEYKRRKIYIEHRTDKFLENFKNSVEYSFDDLPRRAQIAKRDLAQGFDLFASGVASIESIKELAVNFKDSCRRLSNQNPIDQLRTNLDQYEAERIINGELLQKMFEVFGEDIYKEEELDLIAPPRVELNANHGIQTSGKTLDQIKAEALRLKKSPENKKKVNKK